MLNKLKLIQSGGRPSNIQIGIGVIIVIIFALIIYYALNKDKLPDFAKNLLNISVQEEEENK
jgi:hypothetical protein